jgi:hypothetical protein
MRIALVAAGLVLVGATTTACGGPPEDASKDEFCDVMVENNPFDGGTPSQDDFDDWVDELKDTGTPDNISDDARKGFEVMIDAMEDFDVDDAEAIDDLDEFVDDKDDQKAAEKFSLYFVKECIGELPSGLGSDLPTDVPSLPTDLPSGFPSDFPTSLPSDFPTDLSSGLPSDYLSMLSDMATAYQSQ